MTKVLILGANGKLARNTTSFFLEHPEVQLTLYLCRASRLKNPEKGEPFKGHDVSLNSLSELIVKLALSPGMEVRRSLGVSRAG